MVTRKQGHKQLDIVFFDKLFRGVWARLVPQLGVISVHSVLEQARGEAMVHYPILEHFRVRGDGIDLAGFNGHRAPGQPERVEQALWAYLEILINLLARFSGESVSRGIISYILAQEKGKRLSSLFYRTGLKF